MPITIDWLNYDGELGLNNERSGVAYKFGGDHLFFASNKFENQTKFRLKSNRPMPQMSASESNEYTILPPTFNAIENGHITYTTLLI